MDGWVGGWVAERGSRRSTCRKAGVAPVARQMLHLPQDRGGWAPVVRHVSAPAAKTGFAPAMKQVSHPALSRCWPCSETGVVAPAVHRLKRAWPAPLVRGERSVRGRKRKKNQRRLLLCKRTSKITKVDFQKLFKTFPHFSLSWCQWETYFYY